jgi:hypothetical protein
VPRVKKSGGKAHKTPHSRARGVKPAARGGSGPKSARGRGRSAAKGARGKPTERVVSFKVRELNAQQKCGHETSVERLFRVDETVDGAPRAHLVFLDRRHGWYCEHGVECPAVNHARRTRAASTQSVGRT